MTRRLFGTVLLMVPLGACQMMVNGANKLGSYMPTIGERCENWQCITSEGKAKSDALKQNKEEDEKAAMIRHDWEEDPPNFPTTTSAKATPAATKAQGAEPTPYDQHKSR